MPITILHLCEHFGGADASLHGVARSFQWWIPAFDASRFRILLCSRKGRDKAAEQMEAGGLTPLYLGYGKADPRNLTALIRLLKREKVDIIHAHGFGACAWGRLAGHILGKPVIVHGRCNYHTVPLVMRPVERILGPRTKYAFAVSESTRRYTIEQRHIPAAAVKVLYNGILLDRIPAADRERTHRFRADNGVPADGKVVGIVGRIVSHKGHLDTFKAVRDLVTEMPGLRLWVIGDGDYMPVLRTWLTDNSLDSHVRLFGFRRDVLEIIRCFDVQVFPSHFEGTPNTLFEALAVGNCIVAAPTDGQGEILVDEDTALMYRLGDSSDMARQLRRALTDKVLASRLRQRALKRSADFDGRKTIETMQAMYEEIIRKS